ncbi:hypothetical protein L218DRAFT_878505 [Marasmius fiardii PR-910]|nr:hypothetical protein L218DRAFT_878505 [Marasmius fiardii PR-910]
MFSAKFIPLFALALVSVNAQDSASGSGSGTDTATTASTPTSSAAGAGSTAGITPCILGCVTQAATQAGCQSFTDVTCVCTNTAFQNAAGQCLQSTCTPDEVTAAMALQEANCANAGGST